MFKKVKRGKLSLSRETVRGLQTAELGRAAGGVFKKTAWGMCSFTNIGPDTHGDQETPCPSGSFNPCPTEVLDLCAR